MAQAFRALRAKQTTDRFAMACTGAGVTIAIGSFLYDFVPHTFLVTKFKEGLTMLRIGKPVPLDENVKKLFDSVLDDLKLHPDERVKFEPFTVGGFEVYNAGVPSGKFYSAIGLPINFTYEDVSSINATDMRIGLNKESLNIYHPQGENLLESLVLSDKAKKFAIAREVLMAQKCVPIYRSLESPAILIGSVFVAEFLRLKMNLKKRPFSLTVATYAGAGIMGIMLWLQLRDATNTYFERQVDKEVAELGKDYVEGGKEFYDSLMKRNIALRTLLGGQGPKLYKQDGDEVIFIRQKRTPLSYRRKFFSDYLSSNSAQQPA